MIDGLGNPCGTGHVTGEDGSIAVGEESLTAARAQGWRVAETAAALKAASPQKRSETAK
ncbi:hypothetical protein ACFQ51_37170 [Streptomyces kaempferi]